MGIPEKPEKPPEDASLADKWRWMKAVDGWKTTRAIKEQKVGGETSSEGETEE